MTTLHRPGIQALIAAAKSGRVDIIYADAMDRLSRNQADIVTLFEQLRFLGIQIVTRAEGPLPDSISIILRPDLATSIVQRSAR